jgi:hypothetical protein
MMPVSPIMQFIGLMKTVISKKEAEFWRPATDLMDAFEVIETLRKKGN